jgi:hypothetical protein
LSDELDDEQIEEPSALRRQLEEKAREAADAQSRLAALERKMRSGMRVWTRRTSNTRRSSRRTTVTSPRSGHGVRDRAGIDRHPSVAVLPAPVPEEERDAVARITEASNGDGQPPPVTDREKEIRQEMEIAGRKGDNARLDALASELSRVRGFKTLNDLHPI